MIKNLNHIERTTFKYHLISSVLTGFLNGIILFQEVIAKKALMAAGWQITLITMMMPISSVFSIHWAELAKKRPNSKFYIMLVGYLGRLIFLLFFLINSANQFLVLLFIFFFTNSLLIPVQSMIFQNNYTSINRGRLFSYSTSVATFVTLAVSYAAGKLLDYSEESYRIIFALAGVAGFFACYYLSKIEFEKVKSKLGKVKLPKPAFVWKLFIDPFREMMKVFAKDKDFYIFERNFFVYGMAYMTVLPVIPIYFVDELNMSYQEISVAKGMITQAIIIMLLPLLGKISDRINPAKFSFWIFGILIFYPLIMGLTKFTNIDPVYLVYLSFTFFGIGMAGVIISWNIGAIYFAAEGEGGSYMGIHVTLTGIRGLFMPVAGYLIYKYTDSTTAFMVSAFLFLLASILMLRLNKRLEKKNSKS